MFALVQVARIRPHSRTVASLTFISAGRSIAAVTEPTGAFETVTTKSASTGTGSVFLIQRYCQKGSCISFCSNYSNERALRARPISVRRTL